MTGDWDSPEPLWYLASPAEGSVRRERSVVEWLSVLIAGKRMCVCECIVGNVLESRSRSRVGEAVGAQLRQQVVLLASQVRVKQLGRREVPSREDGNTQERWEKQQPMLTMLELSRRARTLNGSIVATRQMQSESVDADGCEKGRVKLCTAPETAIWNLATWGAGACQCNDRIAGGRDVNATESTTRLRRRKHAGGDAGVGGRRDGWADDRGARWR
ncbi:uncharacterized protein BDR25DRAFT_316873 [Lindgomyces ingoldianus]|uniref:Uncharacterized protein n=1 Tax=Lindgomyces ingoldianus TaxID=673940 RepID=A0ACB6QLZ6_9PLEO|nr:uncharacterized protein BDR25DRAFT_316873 [Lindgomyces ingoldianus]KAF2467545.1 hypothetical protein BDR25DRAFT_316873 [Lindgomyces ingoldianus]